MRKIKKSDLDKIDKLLNRLKNIPDILHLRAAEIGYELSGDDKQLLHNTYEELEIILRETSAFINVKFRGRRDIIDEWNKVDFDPKIGPIKILTTDRNHTARAWKSGLLDLRNLLEYLRSEVSLRVEEDVDAKNSQAGKNNFSGNIIYNESSNYGNQSISNNKRENSTLQTQNPGRDIKKRRSWLEVAAWISAIIGALIAIATFMFSV